jgi:hypothetical protein
MTREEMGPEEMSTAPVRREIRVGAPADRTFTLFTDRIGEWWPLGDHAVYGDGAVAFEDRRSWSGPVNGIHLAYCD